MAAVIGRAAIALAVTLGLTIYGPARAGDVARWQPLIAEASARFGVPAPWIARVMAAESGGMTVWRGQPITSPAGAMGLMQLMPATWAAMRARLGLGSDPYQPRDNILAGTLYLRLLYDRFGYPGLFGAYNAGPGRYRAWLDGVRRLPGETVTYMAVTSGKASPVVSGAVRARPASTLFFAQTGGMAALGPSGLFIALASSERARGE